MCLEESFCPYTRECTEFLAAENICHTAQQFLGFPSLSAVITMPRDASFNISLYYSAQLLLMLTLKAKSAQITRRQDMSM